MPIKSASFQGNREGANHLAGVAEEIECRLEEQLPLEKVPETLGQKLEVKVYNLVAPLEEDRVLLKCSPSMEQEGNSNACYRRYSEM